MYDSLVSYNFEGRSGDTGFGRVFAKFAHTPPTMNDILDLEKNLRKSMDANTVSINNVVLLTVEKEDDYAGDTE